MSLRLLVLVVTALVTPSSAAVTFQRDVLPILQKHCQSCHRPGEIAPMSLMTYDQVRPWAKAIRESVVLRKMPPWFAESGHARFWNDRSLKKGEIDTLAEWASTGAQAGDPQDAPPPKQFASGWQIGEPDVVFELPKEFQVPATGVVDYQWIMMPTGFTEDHWIQAAELRPGNRAVVHHAIAYSREPDSTYARNYPHGEFFEYVKDLTKRPKQKDRTMLTPVDEPNHLHAWAPGASPAVFAPGQARLIKAGSDIVFQLHYTTTGKAGSDRSRLGLVFAKTPVTERVKTMAVVAGKKIEIPPGEPNYRMQSRVEVIHPVRVIAMMPHMHLRGKSFEYRVDYPNGESEVLLRVPRFDFYWQLTYHLEKPRLLPVGTIVTCTAVYDNSPNNRNNPDPSATVKGGLQSWDEMMSGHIEIGYAPETEGKTFFRDAAAAPLMTTER